MCSLTGLTSSNNFGRPSILNALANLNTITKSSCSSGTADRFNNFLQNIKLTSSQKEDAKNKYDGVCKKLHDHFYDNNYSGDTKLLVGSYGKKTNIRPARDVDVFFKIPWDKFSSSYGSQSNLLQKVRNILKERYYNTDIRADRNVVVVNFSNTHFIELIPCFEHTIPGELKGKFSIPDSTNGGSWKLVDPKAEIEQINNSDKITNGNTKNLIKMIKKWQQNLSSVNYNGRSASTIMAAFSIIPHHLLSS